MLAQLLRMALGIAAGEIRAELRERRKLAQPARTQARQVVAGPLCGECGRTGKRACPKCNRELCGRCACSCKRTRPAQSLVQTRTPPAPTASRPPQAFSVNHRVGLGTVREVSWHPGNGCWTYRLEWSNGASAWLLERDLLMYTKINP